MTKRLLFAFLVLALTVACAKTYWVTFYIPSAVAGVELKPGEYRLDLDGSQVTLKNGKLVAESAVKVEQNGEKYKRTTIRYLNGDGGCQVQEIRLGGTNTKLVFN
jgi:hypothetical protein